MTEPTEKDAGQINDAAKKYIERFGSFVAHAGGDDRTHAVAGAMVTSFMASVRKSEPPCETEHNLAAAAITAATIADWVFRELRDEFPDKVPEKNLFRLAFVTLLDCYLASFINRPEDSSETPPHPDDAVGTKH